jgi:outer membrane protein insertion porin family
VKSLSFSIVLTTALSASIVLGDEIDDVTEIEDTQILSSIFEPQSQMSYGRTNLKGTGNLTVGIWYSQADALSLSFGIEQANLFGTDEQFRLSIEASAYTQTAQLTLTDPDFYETAYSRQLSFSMYNIEPNRTQNGDYSFSGAEASIAFGRQMTETFSFSFGAGIGQTRISSDPQLPDFILNYVALEGETNTSVFTFLNLVFDHTDGSPYPSNGYRVGFANEVGAISGTTYLKTQTTGSYFTQVYGQIGLRMHGSLALGRTLGNGTFPIFENYFAGGPGSVRGYGQNTLGPTSAIPGSTDRAFAGGQMRVVGGIELSSPIASRDDLHFLGFYDVGNVFASVDDFNASDLRSSVGMGVRWDSVIGPISAYASQAINDQFGDDIEKLQFTLGARF